MTTWGVSMVKDEADIIAGCLRHMATQVDGLIVADNGSTDGTRDILGDLAKKLPLTVLDDPDPAYYQSAKMTRLAEAAAAMGAMWIVPFDADELWTSQERFVLGDVLSALPAAFTVVRADLFDHRSTALDSDDPDPFWRMRWREAQPAVFGKVAFRWQPGARIHQGNHGVDLPVGAAQAVDERLQVRHFQWRSADHFERKVRNGAAAYRASTLPMWEGAHWRTYGDLLDRKGPDALAAVYRQQYWYPDPAASGLVHDPAPYVG